MKLKVLSVAIIYFLMQGNAHALFRKADKQLGIRPIFKNDTIGTIYFIASPGFMVYSNFANIDTFQIPMNSVLSSTIGKLSSSGNYNTYVNIGIGYKSNTSILRHELEFSYMNTYSDQFPSFTNETSAAVNVLNTDGTTTSKTISYMNYNGDNSLDLVSVGLFSKQYRLLYNFYLNFDNVFDIKGTTFDLFASAGVGLSFIKSGIYNASSYTLTTQTITDTSTSATTQETFYQLTNNSITSYGTAQKNSLVSSDMLMSVATKFSVGTVINITSIFVLQLDIAYSMVTKPILNITGHNQVSSSINSENIMMSYVAFEIGIIFKGTEI